DIKICNTAQGIDQASRVVFPGQGAMPDCMRTLNTSGLREAVLRAARSKPLLGVCVGEQMLFSNSEEGNVDCLDFLPDHVRRFAGPQFAKATSSPGGPEQLKVPHMGWSPVQQVKDHALWRGIPDHTHFYFVHSYYAAPGDPELTVGV